MIVVDIDGRGHVLHPENVNATWCELSVPLESMRTDLSAWYSRPCEECQHLWIRHSNRVTLGGAAERLAKVLARKLRGPKQQPKKRK